MKKLTIVLSVIVVFSCLVWAQAPPPAGQQPAPPDPAAGQQPVGQRPAAPQPAAPPPAGQQPAAPAGAPEPSQLQNWSGTLLDATCRQADAKGKCPVSGTTTAFGLSTSDGKYYKFDEAGNTQAGKEMQKAGTKSGDVTASVSGTLDGDTIKVQSIQIQ